MYLSNDNFHTDKMCVTKLRDAKLHLTFIRNESQFPNSQFDNIILRVCINVWINGGIAVRLYLCRQTGAYILSVFSVVAFLRGVSASAPNTAALHPGKPWYLHIILIRIVVLTTSQGYIQN
jgi:hypothetical protein